MKALNWSIDIVMRFSKIILMLQISTSTLFEASIYKPSSRENQFNNTRQSIYESLIQAVRAYIM